MRLRGKLRKSSCDATSLARQAIKKSRTVLLFIVMPTKTKYSLMAVLKMKMNVVALKFSLHTKKVCKVIANSAAEDLFFIVAMNVGMKDVGIKDVGIKDMGIRDVRMKIRKDHTGGPMAASDFVTLLTLNPYRVKHTINFR